MAEKGVEEQVLAMERLRYGFTTKLFHLFLTFYFGMIKKFPIIQNMRSSYKNRCAKSKQLFFNYR